jgi:hypothetical protein
VTTLSRAIIEIEPPTSQIKLPRVPGLPNVGIQPYVLPLQLLISRTSGMISCQSFLANLIAPFVIGSGSIFGKWMATHKTFLLIVSDF